MSVSFRQETLRSERPEDLSSKLSLKNCAGPGRTNNLPTLPRHVYNLEKNVRTISQSRNFSLHYVYFYPETFSGFSLSLTYVHLYTVQYDLTQCCHTLPIQNWDNIIKEIVSRDWRGQQTSP